MKWIPVVGLVRLNQELLDPTSDIAIVCLSVSALTLWNKNGKWFNALSHTNESQQGTVRIISIKKPRALPWLLINCTLQVSML